MTILGEAIGALPAFDAIADQVKLVCLGPYDSWGGRHEKNYFGARLSAQ